MDIYLRNIDYFTDIRKGHVVYNRISDVRKYLDALTHKKKKKKKQKYRKKLIFGLAEHVKDLFII